MRLFNGTLIALILLCRLAWSAVPALEIISPHGGEVFVIGQTQQVRVQTKLRGVLAVEISRDGGATFAGLGSIDTLSKTTSRNSLNFIVAAPASSNCMVRVRSSGAKGDVSATGNAFAITSPQNLQTTGSVTSESLAASAVGTPALADGSVTTPKLADGAVISAKISSGESSNGFVLTSNGAGLADWKPLPTMNSVTSISATPPLAVANPTTTPTISIAVGTTAGTVAAGDDARFSDARIASNSSLSPAANKIPLSDNNGKIDDGWLSSNVALNASVATKVSKSGDTMTGNLKLPVSGPIADEEAATKKYVDTTAASATLPATAIVLTETTTPLSGFTVLPATVKNESVWKNSTPLPSARQVAATAVVNGKIYLIGGFDGSYLTNTDEFDPGTQTWNSKAAMPTPRNGMAIAVVNNMIYVIGGYNGTEVNVTEVYDPQNDSWTTKAPMPTARELTGFGAVGNKIYVIGGSANSVTLSANEEYDTALDSWTVKAPLPTPRYGIGSDVYSGKIFLIGGRNAGGAHFGTNEAYDPSNDSWQTFASMPTPRQSLSATLVGSKIYCVGGKDASTYVGANEAYDVIADSWSSRSGMPTPRYRHAAAVISGILHVMGGFDGATYSLHQLFDPSQTDTFYLQRKN